MYGMIHRGLREMVIEQAGPALWTEIEQDLQIGPAELISLNLYDDELTMRILARVADRMGTPQASLLHTFGRSWVQFAQRGAFGGMFDFTGRSLREFLGNLDRLHQAVIVAMPEARVPSFALVKDDGDCLLVDYRSERTGLEPFVVGLLEGLLDRFAQRGSVREVGAIQGGARFEITLASQ